MGPTHVVPPSLHLRWCVLTNERNNQEILDIGELIFNLCRIDRGYGTMRWWFVRWTPVPPRYSTTPLWYRVSCLRASFVVHCCFSRSVSLWALGVLRFLWFLFLGLILRLVRPVPELHTPGSFLGLSRLELSSESLLLTRWFVKTLVRFALSYSSACMLAMTMNWGFT